MAADFLQVFLEHKTIIHPTGGSKLAVVDLSERCRRLMRNLPLYKCDDHTVSTLKVVLDGSPRVSVLLKIHNC